MVKISEKVVVALTIVLLFLTSCQPPEKIIDNSTTNTSTEISIKGCIPHWECADEDYKHFQAENCSWSKPEKCERGCANASCTAAPTCTVGFKCIDDSRKGYQKEDCSFISKIDCEWGCDNGKCQEKSANILTNVSVAQETKPKYSAITENNDEVAPEQKTIYTLKWGEQQQFEVGGNSHNISIYDLEQDQVTIKVDNLKSSWIMEKQNYTYANIGATFTIESILYQAYAGGKQEIEYSIKALS